jgi:multiple sugar transport system substrate-binding protein
MMLLRRKPIPGRAFFAGSVCEPLLAAGCGWDGDDGVRSKAREDTTGDSKLKGTPDISVWFRAGPSGELDTMRRRVEDFNAAQQALWVEPVARPEERPYADLVESGVVGGDLPDFGKGTVTDKDLAHYESHPVGGP